MRLWKFDSGPLIRMILAYEPPVTQAACGPVADLKVESSGPVLRRGFIAQELKQGLLDIVALANQQPLARIGKPIDSRQCRHKVKHIGCVKGPGCHVLKRQLQLV